MEEPVFLRAVQRCVRGVEVQNQPPRWDRMRRHELLDQDFVNRPGGVPVGPLFQSAQCRRTGQRLHPVGRRLQGQVVTQFPMIVQILMAQGQCV